MNIIFLPTFIGYPLYTEHL